jgi:hypothetical protein
MFGWIRVTFEQTVFGSDGPAMMEELILAYEVVPTQGNLVWNAHS